MVGYAVSCTRTCPAKPLGGRRADIMLLFFKRTGLPLNFALVRCWRLWLSKKSNGRNTGTRHQEEDPSKLQDPFGCFHPTDP